MDRISTLSDDLLLKILSSLCTKAVVSTMFLSKRWKFLWTMVPKLDFEEGGYEYARFREYVDRFLVLHKSPVLETLKFKTRFCSNDMATWVRIAIARSVRELEINRVRFDGIFNSFELPQCLYTFKNLVVLKLYNSIVVDVSGYFNVSLSSLKTLHLLSVVYRREDSLSRLLSGCPVLEELVVEERDSYSPVRSLSVIMPSLERLSILLKHGKSVYSTINVPSLKYLSYVDVMDFGNLCLSEDMPEVVEANVKLVCKGPEKLMRSLTSVKRLSLCLHDAMLQHLIGFHQLVYLELCGCGPRWWELLTRMLESSPKLQVLKLDKCRERCHSSIVPIKKRWGTPSSVPECLLLHLNTFEWKYYNGRKEEKKLVAYILNNASHLKTASFSNREGVRQKKGTPCNKLVSLASLPRASKSCQLLLD